MAEVRPRRIALTVPWTTIFKILVAAAAVWAWRELVWIVMLVLIALIIAVGLAPAVAWLERRRVPRWLAAAGLVILIVGLILGFFALTYTQLTSQVQNLGQQLSAVEEQVMNGLPAPIAEIVRSSGTKPDVSMLAGYGMTIARATLAGLAAFVLAWILVVYLLIEAEATYRWVRGFVPEAHRRRFDRTAGELREVAFGFVIGNMTTSACAAIYFFVWLTILDIPAALLLAMLAFVFDFIPVLGFYLSCLPAMAMAATTSTTLTLAMIPIYLSYDFIENYLIAPRIYGNRLRLSKVAVLVAFAVGAQLGGVVGAVLALPIAASYPTIERHWLRRPFGDDVVEEHERLQSES